MDRWLKKNEATLRNSRGMAEEQKARFFAYAVLLIFVVAAVITPDSSPVSQVLVAGPMVGLYIVGIAVAWAFGKSKKQDPEDA